MCFERKKERRPTQGTRWAQGALRERSAREDTWTEAKVDRPLGVVAQAVRANSLGDTPVMRRNLREKWLWSKKPSLSAMVQMV
jgi:hypothetical protein